jgi:hypothetical protein
MSEDERSEPDSELARLLSALPTAIPPPEVLEDRAVRALRTPRPLSRRVFAAAAIVLFACGLAAGRLLPASAPSSITTGGYLLLLYEDDGYRAAAPGGESARVSEYRAWAREIAEGGIAIGGERLEDDGVELQWRDGVIARRHSSGRERLGGYFVLGAASRAEAERIAMTCPHLRHGGRVVVTRILPT